MLCPLAQEGHDASTKHDTTNHEGNTLVVFCAKRIKEEVSRQQLNQTRVDENASTGRVKDPRDNVLGNILVLDWSRTGQEDTDSSVRVSVVSIVETEPDRNTHRSRQTVRSTQDPRKHSMALGKWDG